MLPTTDVYMQNTQPSTILQSLPSTPKVISSQEATHADSARDHSPSVHSDVSEIEFDSWPSTIPETQLATAPETQILSQDTLITKVQAPTALPPRSPMRRYVKMIWEPTGDIFQVDFRHMRYDRFLDAVNDIQLELGPEPPGHQYVKENGVHYSIDGAKECILTMAEEYEVFTERLAFTRDSSTIVIKPVNIIVSFWQQIWVT